MTVEVRSEDDAPADEPWLIPPPGWMLGMVGPTSDEWRFVCSEPCLRVVTSRRRGSEVASELDVHDKARQAWDVVTSSRKRDLGDEAYCSHCREEIVDETLTDGRDDWCSKECKACQSPGGWCDHTSKHLGRLEREHRTLCDEVDRLRYENGMLRGTLGSAPNEREMETAAAEIMALDGRATAAPWGEKCGVVKHYVFSKDPREDFGASLQEMHWNDGHVVPAHDNASLIAFYRNYAPSLARSWASLCRRNHLWAARMNVVGGALRTAEETLSMIRKRTASEATFDLVHESIDHIGKAMEQLRLGMMELDRAKED